LARVGSAASALEGARGAANAPAPPNSPTNRPQGLATMKAIKPFLVTALVVLGTLFVLHRFAPASVKSIVYGS
jgi:hypothetical protein